MLYQEYIKVNIWLETYRGSTSIDLFIECLRGLWIIISVISDIINLKEISIIKVKNRIFGRQRFLIVFAGWCRF